MLKYLDEPQRSAAWVNHAVLAVSLGLNALFIFHALDADPIGAEDDRGSVGSAATAGVDSRCDATIARSPMDACAIQHEDRIQEDRIQIEPEEPSLAPSAPELPSLRDSAVPAPPITEVGAPARSSSGEVHL